MSAAMDGETQKFSSVINMKHKISSSRPKLMQYDDRVLGSGATNFARENGFGSFSAETPQRRAE
jgi:L-asparaginase